MDIQAVTRTILFGAQRLSPAMRELHTQIEINAPAPRIWQILTDFKSYPRWNPFIRSLSGEPKEGSRLRVFIQPPGSRGMRLQPVVLIAEPSKELRWLGRLFVPGLFDGEHRFVIEPSGGSRVIFTQSEKFRGLLVPLLWKSLDKSTREGFNQMNGALKRLAEGKCKGRRGRARTG